MSDDPADLIDQIREHYATIKGRDDMTQARIKQKLYEKFDAVNDNLRRSQIDTAYQAMHKLEGAQQNIEYTTGDALSPSDDSQLLSRSHTDHLLQPSTNASASSMHDVFTEMTYINEQRDIVKHTQYQDILKKYREGSKEIQGMETHLLRTGKEKRYKTKEELRKECEDDSCEGHTKDTIFTKCPCMQRIKLILEVYHAILQNDKLWTKVPMSPIIQVRAMQSESNKEESVYGHQQIMDDFYHIKLIHIDRDKNANYELDEKKQAAVRGPEIAQEIYNKLSIGNPCIDSITELSKCKGFLRHYRDRTNREQEEEMFHIVRGSIAENQKQSAKTTEIRNEKEFIFQELLDSIHSYFLHSLMQYSNDGRAEPEYEKAINATVDTINQTAQGRSFALEALEKQSDAKDEQTGVDAKTKPYPGKKEDDKWLLEFHVARIDQNTYTQIKGYNILVRNMGFFRWQNVHGFGTSESRNIHSQKEGKYKNFKDEVLMNSFHPISKENWNQTLRKAKLFDASIAKTRIRSTGHGEYRDQIANTTVKWKSNEIISFKEIITLKLYTDFDKLQFELKKCFRFEAQQRIIQRLNPQPEEAKDDEYKEVAALEDKAVAQDQKAREELEVRLQEFWHWRLELLVILHKYGQAISWRNKNVVLYHGVNQKMIFNPGEMHHFWGPLSTTSSYHVAKTFATAKGMVLKISTYYPRKDVCRAFDASLISDYPEEQEWLIGFMYLRVLEVKTRPIVHSPQDAELWEKAPLSSQIRVIFFSVHLFKEQIFSMSEHLEFYLIQFLKCNQFECCQKSPYKSYDELRKAEKHKSFLSWICCSVAEHKLTLANTDDFQLTTLDIKSDKTEIVRILWKRFWNDLSQPNQRQVVKIDTVSDGLKKLLLDEQEEKDIYENTRYRVSLTKVLQIFPNVTEIQFLNHYRFDNAILDELLMILQQQSRATIDEGLSRNLRNEPQERNLSALTLSDPPQSMEQRNIPKVGLIRLVFNYYDYVDARDENGEFLKVDHPADSDSFFHPDGLDDHMTEKLEKYNWEIRHKPNGSWGYKIEVQRKSQKDTFLEALCIQSESILQQHISKIDWQSTKVRSEPHEWVYLLIEFLNNVDKIKDLPQRQRHSAYINTLSRMQQYIIRVFLSPALNKWNVISMYNFNLDITRLDEHCRQTQMPDLHRTFDSLKQLLSLLLSGKQITEYLDEEVRTEKYPDVETHHVRTMLEKCKTFGKIATFNKVPTHIKIHKLDADTVQKMLETLPPN